MRLPSICFFVTLTLGVLFASSADAQVLPSGTVIQLPSPEAGPPRAPIVLETTRFLIDRTTLDLYNAQAGELTATVVALNECEADLRTATRPKQPSWLGRYGKVGAIALGVSTAFVLGYALGGG
jgi:hypothetical protein